MPTNKDYLHTVQLADGGSKLKLLYNLLIVFFTFPFTIPHLLLLAVHPARKIILSDTITVKNFIMSLIFCKHYRNLFYYRIGNAKYLFKWILPEHDSIKIPVRLQMGKSAHFVHNISSFLNAKSIGDYFVCYHHVTLGESRLGDGTGKPVIGNNVTIYTGAVVVGGVTIGDNVKIGANTVIIKDVPSDCSVLGSPAKITRLKGQKVDILL